MQPNPKVDALNVQSLEQVQGGIGFVLSRGSPAKQKNVTVYMRKFTQKLIFALFSDELQQ